MKAAILAIGTELTTGQILNRNAHWISGRLKALGFLTSVHMVVPDNRVLIAEALKFCEDKADLLFVTGGLGPTTDDFTRDLILEWTGQEKIFHEESWQHVQNRLTSRGIQVREFQRQQCYYPNGAEVLFNKNGTANGFQLEHMGKNVFVLPGPPNEIEAVWDDYIHAKMMSMASSIDPWITLSWDCLGHGESEIAALTEKALEGSGLEIGYRVHLPYVEVKVSFQRSQTEKELNSVSKSLTQLENLLTPYVVLKNGADAAEQVASALLKFKNVILIDSMTGFHLLNRLFPFSRQLFEQKRIQYLTNKNPPAHADLILEISAIGADHCQVSQTYQSQKHSQIFSSPYLKLLMKDRERQYFTEMALLYWAQKLQP